MAQLFPKWSNYLPAVAAIGFIFLAVGLIVLIWYFASPWYIDVGYQPTQPVEYSHKLHAGDLNINCLYCHNYVERSTAANIPPTQTCMNCHSIIGADKETLQPVRDSRLSGLPIEWIRIHNIPDYAYFDHSSHLDAGVGCFSCHGNIAAMPKVTQVQPLSMSWCLDCHRDPSQHLRPREQLTAMDWSPPENQIAWAAEHIRAKNINPPTECSGCHR